MKTVAEVSSDKLRGGFYTPDSLVRICLDRIAELCGSRMGLDVLEPSVGDGAFLRGLANHPLERAVNRFLGIEILDFEAQKCREVAEAAPFDATILTTSSLEWAVSTQSDFDVVMGNPPFVRFQFISKEDVFAAERLCHRLGLSYRGVSNLWIPILLGALNRLRLGGSMALVVPAEIFTGVSAGQVRAWLVSRFESLKIDMFEPGSFPDVLQEVVVLSGKRTEMRALHLAVGTHSTKVQFNDHAGPRVQRRFSHNVAHDTSVWTKYLLTPTQLNALKEAENLPSIQCFGRIAKLEVSIVTGANEFFSVDSADVAAYDLYEWAEPLLPRIRHASGLIFDDSDYKALLEEGVKAWLLNFSGHHRDPLTATGASRYLAHGEMLKLHTRYKTSNRSPWYRVPSVRPDKLMLSKRAHLFHRLVYNEIGVLTTDTIYRGRMLAEFKGHELDLVTGFHNSLTLLTAELEGRSFGGGVLELVPSEIARLKVPYPIASDGYISKLDRIARDAAHGKTDPEALIEATDRLILRNVPGLTSAMMHRIHDARKTLLDRRMSRN